MAPADAERALVVVPGAAGVVMLLGRKTPGSRGQIKGTVPGMLLYFASERSKAK